MTPLRPSPRSPAPPAALGPRSPLAVSVSLASWRAHRLARIAATLLAAALTAIVWAGDPDEVGSSKPLPDPFPAGLTPAPGVVLERITHTNTFGFMMMERDTGADAPWLYKAYTRDGKLLTTCVPAGSKIACDKTGFLAP